MSKYVHRTLANTEDRPTGQWWGQEEAEAMVYVGDTARVGQEAGIHQPRQSAGTCNAVRKQNLNLTF